MKLFAVVGTAGLAAILSMSMPVYAQDESHPQEDKRAQPDAKDARPSDRQDDKRAEQDRGQETNQETNRETNKDKKQDDHARPADRQADQDRNHDRDNRNGEQQARQDERHDQQAQSRPPWLSGAVVGTARKSLQLNPRSPGNVLQPN